MSDTLAGAAPMRARRCPRAVIAVWAFRTALATLAAAPVAALARQAFPAPPLGDAILWTPGGHALLSFGAREAHGLSAAATGAAIVLVAGAIAGIVPTAALMVAVAQSGEARGTARAARAAAATVARLPAFARLAIGVVAAQVAIVAAAYFLGRVAFEVTSGAIGEAPAEVVGTAVTAVTALPALALSVAEDLARASIVRFRRGALAAFFAASTALGRTPIALAWAWLWRAAASLVPVAAAAAVASWAGGSVHPAALVLLALVHQSAAFARIALRASWLAKALRSAAP